MQQDVHHHTFGNGLTLLAERMEHVRSAAFNFMIPCGSVHDPEEHLGLGSVLADLITRGAGDRDSRALALALDNLGVDRGESVGALHMRFWGGTLSRNLGDVLALYGDILRRPRLPAEDLPAVQALALQDLQSLEDEPRSKLLVELRQRFFSFPLGRDRRGTKAGIEALTPQAIRQQYERLFQPRGSILSVAGNFDWNRIRDVVEKHFGDWQPKEGATVSSQTQPATVLHMPKETTQTQIGIAYPSVPVGHDDYYAAMGAVNVLSGGMSARLFTEVREKRGLCYSVWASYQTFKTEAGVICYAGTTNERAQETFDVTLAELTRLKEGITDEEVERVRAGLKSSLIMQEESTAARAGALASDWYFLKRVRSFDEIAAAINGLTPKQMVDHLHRFPPGNFTVVTLGPKELTLPSGNGVPR